MITLMWLVIIIIVFVLAYQNYEPEDLIIEGMLNTFTGRLAIDDQYFYDKMFDDVYYYPNGSGGCFLCKSSCSGHCVEYGPTNNCHCFPY